VWVLTGAAQARFGFERPGIVPGRFASRRSWTGTTDYVSTPSGFSWVRHGSARVRGKLFRRRCPRVVASAMHTIYVVARISASKCYQCHVAIKPDDIVVTFDSGASIHVRCWPVNTRNLSPLRRRSPRAMRRSRAGVPRADQATLRGSVDVLSQRLPADALRC